MIKAILIDADGVAIKPRKRLSSKLYAEKYDIPYELIDSFFRDKFPPCIRGKADLKKEIAPYVSSWGEIHTVDKFLEEWFQQENAPETRVLAVIKQIRKRIPVHLASDQEKYRASYIWNEMKFKEYFNTSFFSSDVGNSKEDKEFFKKVLQQLDLHAEEVMFWDDDPKNIAVAKSLGIDAYFFESFEKFETLLKEKHIL